MPTKQAAGSRNPARNTQTQKQTKSFSSCTSSISCTVSASLTYAGFRTQRTQAELLKINCKRKRLGILLTKIWKTCSTNQRHEPGRLKHAGTEKNVTTADEMAGLRNHEGQKQNRSIRHISKETSRLFPIIVSFSCIYISHGSVATQLKCDGLFNISVIAICSQNVAVKEFWKSVYTYQRYWQEVGRFLRHSVLTRFNQ